MKHKFWIVTSDDSLVGPFSTMKLCRDYLSVNGESLGRGRWIGDDGSEAFVNNLLPDTFRNLSLTMCNDLRWTKDQATRHRIGRLITSARLKQRMTQKTLSNLLGVSTWTVRRFENSFQSSRRMTPAMRKNIADILGIEIEHLYAYNVNTEFDPTKIVNLEELFT